MICIERQGGRPPLAERGQESVQWGYKYCRTLEQMAQCRWTGDLRKIADAAGRIATEVIAGERIELPRKKVTC